VPSRDNNVNRPVTLEPQVEIHDTRFSREMSSRDAVICISLASLVLLNEWSSLLGDRSYIAAPQPHRYVAVMLSSILIAAVFYCGAWIARQAGAGGRLFGKWIFFQVILVGVSALIVRSFHNLFIAAGSLRTFPIIVTAIVFGLPLLLTVRPVFFRWFATALFVISPCVAFLALRAAWELLHVPSPIVERGSVIRLSTDGPRVLLLVFDEMSASVGFSNRPQSVRMPAFDRLRHESLVATSAYPPGGDTLSSMPGLLTGRPIGKVKPVSEKELQVQFLDNQQVESMTYSPNVFSSVHSLGMSTAMIGWYHPYCSLLRDIDYCVHIKADMVDYRYERDSLRSAVADVFAALPFLNDTNWSHTRFAEAAQASQRAEDSFLFEVTRRTIPEFRSGLLVVHLPLPHPPAINGPGIYFANFAHVDNQLRDLRRAMENAGTWEGTTLLVSSDHWWRTHKIWRDANLNPVPGMEWTAEEEAHRNVDEDKRVPFIAKLAGQNTPVTYTEPFNTLLVPKLIFDLVSGKLKSTEDLKSWLDLHRHDVPIHAYESAVAQFAVLPSPARPKLYGNRLPATSFCSLAKSCNFLDNNGLPSVSVGP
jgi:hypothetical protein